MDFQLFKFLHVVTIIAAIALAEGSILPMLLAARRRDVDGVRRFIAAGQIGERVANPLLLASVGFGVLAALNGQIDLTAPWLVASYALLGAAFLMGALGGFRHLERLSEAALASPPDSPSAEFIALLDSRWTGVVSILPPVLVGTIVFLMVTKPNLW